MIRQPLYPKNPIFWIFVSSALLLISSLWFYQFATDIHMAYDAVDWPVVQGKIISSDIVQFESRKGKPYCPRVRYQYTVDGRSYVAQRIAFGNEGCGMADVARKIAKGYAVKDTVSVHYDFAMPGRSALIVGKVLHHTWAATVLSGMMVMMSCVLIVMFFKEMAAARPQHRSDA